MSTVTKNIRYNLIGQLLLLVIGFISVKFIYRQLGKDALGIIYFSMLMNSTLSALLQMGVCATTVREVSAKHESDPGYVKDLIRTSSLFYWSFYIFVAAGNLVFAPLIVEKWLTLEQMDVNTATNVLRIMGISSFLALPISFYTSLVLGLQRMGINNLVDVLTMFLQQLGVVGILVLGGGLFPVVWWIAACYGLRVIIYMAICYQLFGLNAMIPSYSHAVVTSNMHFAGPLAIISILGFIQSQLDKLIISLLMPVSVLGSYMFISGSVQKGRMLPEAISRAVYPSFSQLYYSGRKDVVTAKYQQLQGLFSYGLIPLYAFVPFAFLPIASFLFDEQIARIMLLPSTIICLASYLHATLTMPYIVSLAAGMPEITAKQNVLKLLLIIPLTILLVSKFGLVGGALSLVANMSFNYTYGFRRICKECLGLKPSMCYWRQLVPIICGCIVYGSTFWLASYGGPTSTLWLILHYLGATVAFMTCAYLAIGNDLRNVAARVFIR